VSLSEAPYGRLASTEELPLLRDHLLRLDPVSRHDRFFHGFIDDSFIVRYAVATTARSLSPTSRTPW
jgi:hypothetical protein